MRINVLKSSILGNHLITSQWGEPLTSVRETTSNVNGSQGIIGTIHKVWRMIWSGTLLKSPDWRPMMQVYHRMRRTFHWGMQAPSYPKGVSRSTSWIMSWCRHETIHCRRAIMFLTLMMWDKGTRWRCMKQRIRGGRKSANCRRIKLLNISVTWLQKAAAFWYQGIEGHVETSRIEWNEEKWRTKILKGKWWGEDIPNSARRKKCRCSRATSCCR